MFRFRTKYLFFDEAIQLIAACRLPRRFYFKYERAEVPVAVAI